MKELRFAILGTGFWARYQLAAWGEIEGARCVALFNRTRSKAERLASEFGVAKVYDDAEELLQREQPDFVDIITDVGTHRRFVEVAAAHGVPAICQKPMAPTLEDAEAMLSACRKAGVPLLIHENWRWQAPIRAVKKALASGIIGPVFRARLDYCNSFPVFDNQPFLKQEKRFILNDVGTHILDAARFLFGEAKSLCCQTQQVHRDIEGEDVASVMLNTTDSGIVTCHLSYASKVEQDRFPETFVFIEGEHGSIELAPNFWVRVTTEDGTTARRCPPPFYPWADPRYGLVHSSIVDCLRNLLSGLLGEDAAETTGEDNFKTLQLVFASYDSAARNEVVRL